MSQDNIITFHVGEANYHTINKTLTLVSQSGDGAYVIKADVAEGLMRFVSSVFKKGLKKENAKFLENIEIRCVIDQDCTVVDVHRVAPVNLEAYLANQSSLFYIHDIVKSGKQKLKTQKLLSKYDSLHALVNADPGKSDQAFAGYQELAKRLSWCLNYPIYAYKLHVVTTVDNKTRNALAKYFSGYRGKGLQNELEGEVVSFQDFMAVPYLVRRKVEAVSFASLDAMALERDVSYQTRLEYNILNAIEVTMEDGHMYANFNQIQKSLLKAHAQDIIDTKVELLKNTVMSNPLFKYVSDDEIYATAVYNEQVDFVLTMRDLMRREKQFVFDTVEDFIEDYQKRKSVECGYNLELHENQKDAIRAFAQGEPLLVVTGGPGTGKSFVIEAITDMAKSAGRFVVQCAPTGKAAKRLGKQALTIHRLVLRKSNFTETGYLPYDVVIVDESSMIDFQLASNLMSKVDIGRTQVVLVGDPKQLPPITYGCPFNDIINSKCVERIHLTKVFRRDGKSAISELASKIDAGEDIPDELLNNDEVSFYPTENKEQMHKCLNLMCNFIKKTYVTPNGIDKVQVLCCTNEKGTACNKALNEIIHNVIYPGTKARNEYGFCEPSHGEKVLVTKNNYVLYPRSKEVDVYHSSFNGDIGSYVGVGEDFAQRIHLCYLENGQENISEVDVPKENLDLGHSITIHKSQGSEYDTVFLFLDNVPTMLVRELFYTAVTRAKKRLYIFGTKWQIRTCIQNRTPPRASRISHYISI